MNRAWTIVLSALLSLPAAGGTNDLPATEPPAMKGYCIFAYAVSNETIFVLMSGTNIDKVFADIDADESIEGDYVHVKAKGLEQGKALLDRFDPANPESLTINGIRDTPMVRQSTIPAYVEDAPVEAIIALRHLAVTKTRNDVTTTRRLSYEERLRKRREAEQARLRELAMKPQLNAADVERVLQEHQMAAIREGRPLPVPLTAEQDAHLVREGILQPPEGGTNAVPPSLSYAQRLRDRRAAESARLSVRAVDLLTLLRAGNTTDVVERLEREVDSAICRAWDQKHTDSGSGGAGAATMLQTLKRYRDANPQGSSGPNAESAKGILQRMSDEKDAQSTNALPGSAPPATEEQDL